MNYIKRCIKYIRISYVQYYQNVFKLSANISKNPISCILIDHISYWLLVLVISGFIYQQDMIYAYLSVNSRYLIVDSCFQLDLDLGIATV